MKDPVREAWCERDRYALFWSHGAYGLGCPRAYERGGGDLNSDNGSLRLTTFAGDSPSRWTSDLLPKGAWQPGLSQFHEGDSVRRFLFGDWYQRFDALIPPAENPLGAEDRAHGHGIGRSMRYRSRQSAQIVDAE